MNAACENILWWAEDEKKDNSKNQKVNYVIIISPPNIASDTASRKSLINDTILHLFILKKTSIPLRKFNKIIIKMWLEILPAKS